MSPSFTEWIVGDALVSGPIVSRLPQDSESQGGEKRVTKGFRQPVREKEVCQDCQPGPLLYLP